MQIFPEWGGGVAKLLFGILFCQQLHENEKYWTRRRACPDPPQKQQKLCVSLNLDESEEIRQFLGPPTLGSANAWGQEALDLCGHLWLPIQKMSFVVSSMV